MECGHAVGDLNRKEGQEPLGYRAGSLKHAARGSHTSSVATGGPSLPRRVGLLDFSLGKVRWRTNSATNLPRKAFDCCKLFVYIWLLGASPTGPPGLRPWTRWGLPPHLVCPPSLQRLRHCHMLPSNTLSTARNHLLAPAKIYGVRTFGRQDVWATDVWATNFLR